MPEIKIFDALPEEEILAQMELAHICFSDKITILEIRIPFHVIAGHGLIQFLLFQFLAGTHHMRCLNGDAQILIISRFQKFQFPADNDDFSIIGRIISAGSYINSLLQCFLSPATAAARQHRRYS